ncbi:homeobox protein BEL1 [Tripterygium wilfordii]|uniref:Homeobox protein BEL1 n=1 Tax=Tripterygium wilfordii TaxID=458696 RepID=A0A7J7CL72_TRIWF|nr:homeobox protein BEL1 homolog [Tripterygium wilfordii]XP_038724807.1 homeobox protein BEL1 homolog [Tripterygium wilfordii]KAF5734798.1 homeobox protein BEL1 [Tripterygium wilfordii]
MASSSGFCYSDVSSSNPEIHNHLVNQIQGFESNPDMFHLTTEMENLQQSDNNSVMWKGFFGKTGSNSSPPPETALPSSSKTINGSTTDFYHQHHEFNKSDLFQPGISETSSHDHQNLLVAAGSHDHHHSTHHPWQDNRLIVDDSSLRCVFPCEGNERPSQGLSLSLSSNNPSSLGLQSFELRQQSSNQQEDDHHHYHMRFMGKPAGTTSIQQQQQTMQFHLRNSKYLGPAQELLNEFCSIGTKQTDLSKQNLHKPKQFEDENASSSSRKQSLQSLEFMELQKRKTKLLSMLEEVDRKYRHYCDQMKAVVSSFEAVAGHGAANVYSRLASKAMSRHFRCLRDGITSQIQATKKAMGEKDPVAPGTARGETPRLRILDQALRQQKAFQQMNMMETHPWRPQRGLPERSVSVLRAWLFEHFLHPYPSDVDKHILARQTGLSRSQVSNWFINARVRLWKPMVEEIYMEESKEEENNNMDSPDGVSTDDILDDNIGRLNPNPSMDRKPTPDQLLRIEPDSLSSIINQHGKNDPRGVHFNNFGSSFGGASMELDFSSYNHNHHNPDQNFNGGGGGGGVSLTLGLQQHGGSGGGGGVSLAFSPASQSSLFYARDHIEDCQQVQYSLLDGEGQNLPYRNLMEAQLLHDLAG